MPSVRYKSTHQLAWRRLLEEKPDGWPYVPIRVQSFWRLPKIKCTIEYRHSINLTLFYITESLRIWKPDLASKDVPVALCPEAIAWAVFHIRGMLSVGNFRQVSWRKEERQATVTRSRVFGLPPSREPSSTILTQKSSGPHCQHTCLILCGNMPATFSVLQ